MPEDIAERLRSDLVDVVGGRLNSKEETGSLAWWSCSSFRVRAGRTLDNSTEYQPLIAMREKAARTHLIIAEGTEREP